MLTTCTFNPDVDLQEVDELGFVDLHEAFIHGSLPSDLNVQRGSYNDVEDLTAVHRRPADVFEAMNAHRAYTEYMNRATADSSKGN